MLLSSDTPPDSRAEDFSFLCLSGNQCLDSRSIRAGIMRLRGRELLTNEELAVFWMAGPELRNFGRGLRLLYFFIPKICNCWLLATNTWPLATTGTRLASPPRFGHAPAFPLKSWVIVLPPDSGSKAKR